MSTSTYFDSVELHDHYYAMQTNYVQTVPAPHAEYNHQPPPEVYYVISDDDSVAKAKVS